MSDKDHEIGEEFKCPFTGDIVILRNKSVTKGRRADLKPAVLTPPRNRSGKTVMRILVFLVFTFFIIQFCGWLLALTTRVITALLDIVNSTTVAIIEFLPVLVWSIVNLSGFILLFVILHVIALGSIAPFIATLSATRINESSSYTGDTDASSQSAMGDNDLIRRLLGITPLYSDHSTNTINVVPQPADRKILRETVEHSRKTIRIQQVIIGGLIVGITIGQLVCYLSIETLEEARQAVRQAVQIGTPSIILFVIMFYGGVFFFKLDKKLESFSAFRRGLILSMLLGIATVCTLMFIPPLLGSASLPGSAIAIGLTINVIGDVFINMYEVFSERYWKTKGDY